MIDRAILPHVALLVIAAGASISVWTRDKKPVVSAGDVTVWSARSADVQRITFESKTKKVTLEARTDAQGRWFYGVSETSPASAPDAGPAPPPKVVNFVSVTQGNKVAEALAPFKALREVGKIGDDRLVEFGIKEPDGSLSVVIGGKDRRLTIGARTPGGGDRYVRDDGSNVVYVVKGDVTRDLESGDSALSEREPHGFKDVDLESVRVVARGKTRDVLRRGPESKRIWADPSAPEKADETVSNWISKVDRLRPVEYLGAQPSAPEPVVRIEYKAKGVSGAFLEIAKVPGSAPPPATPNQTASTPKSDFIVRSERIRQWAKVNGTVGEQVELDLGSILK